MRRHVVIAALFVVLAPSARADTPPQDLRAAQGFEALAAGRNADAKAAFEAILASDARRLDAYDGLVRALLALGDAEGAAKAADARLAVRPDDEGWKRSRLYVLGLAPSRRAEAIDGWRAIVAAHPDDFEAQSSLALFLSWTPGHVDESVAAWRAAVALQPSHVGARLGLARTLAWSGANGESADLFDALLAEDPKNVDALLGRSQLARWSGDAHTARVLLGRAEAIAPNDPRVRAERARLELDSGRNAIARGAAQSALELSPDLYEGHEAVAALHAATAPRAAVRFTATDESTDFRRLGVAVPVELHPLPDTRVRIEPAFARFSEPSAADAATAQFVGADLPDEPVDRVSLGLDVRQSGLPQGLYARGAYRFNLAIGGGPSHAGALEVGAARPLDLPVDLRVGVRQRALVDLPEDDRVYAPLDVVGSGGGTYDALLDRLVVREAYAGLVLTPLPGLYVYGDGALGDVAGPDAGRAGNARTSVAAGLGEDVLRLLPTRSAHALTVRYDLYHLSVTTPDPRYFSPDAYLVHTPGLEWRWSPGRATVGLEAGVPLRAGAPVGWLAGAYGGVRVGDHLEVAARVRATDDTAWRATGASVGVSGRW